MPSSPHPLPDRFELYELCVQSPGYDARMLAAMHAYCARERQAAPASAASKTRRARLARPPRVLGEDFSGTAALSRAWIDVDPRHRRAVAVDFDHETLERAISLNSAPVVHPMGVGMGPGRTRENTAKRSRSRPGITYILSDVRKVGDPVEVLCALNYSLGEFHERRALVRYLRHARQRINPCGIFVGDLYCGRDAFLLGTTTQERTHEPTGARVRYQWEQRAADPLTAMVENAIHFDVRAGGTAKGGEKRTRAWQHLHDAFVYHWRLWSPAELREAMLEAGFAQTWVFPRHADAVDGDGHFHAQPFSDPEELPESFSCYVVGVAH